MSESDSKSDRTTSQENNVLNTDTNVNQKPEAVKTNTVQQNSENNIFFNAQAEQKSEDKTKKNNDINLEDLENQIITEPAITKRNIEGDQKLEKGLDNDFMNIDSQKSGESDRSKDYSISEPNAKETSDLELENSGKEIDFYFSEPESHLLKDLKKLLKIKLRRKSKKIGKCPETDCRIKVETWEKHDTEACTGEDYTLVGELLFPVCSKEIFYQAPGVPVRNSQKSYTLNDPEKFGKPVLEKRLYAYPDKIIPASVLKMSADEQREMEEWLALHPETANQIGRCNICKYN